MGIAGCLEACGEDGASSDDLLGVGGSATGMLEEIFSIGHGGGYGETDTDVTEAV
jgi:hypothetical protein